MVVLLKSVWVQSRNGEPAETGGQCSKIQKKQYRCAPPWAIVDPDPVSRSAGRYRISSFGVNSREGHPSAVASPSTSVAEESLSAMKTPCPRELLLSYPSVG